jgi:hypothetical protein
MNDFQTGHPVWGLVQTGLAISDVLLVKAAVTAIGKVAVEGTVKLAARETIGDMGERLLREEVRGEPQAFFRTSRGAWFVDQFADGIAHESKVGYQTATAGLKRQALKDAELVETREIEGAAWHFYRSPLTGRIGPSAPLQLFLENHGIEVIIK